MGDYIHGAYGYVKAVGEKSAAKGPAFVYFGTAPVQTIEGGEKTLNKPVVVRNFAEARKLFGYSDDWASYTLCEAAKVHLDMNDVGPLIFVNVLDPYKHQSKTDKTATKTPSSGSFTITDAAEIDLDSIVVETKTEGTDYTKSYDEDTKVITFTEKTTGSLGSDPLTVTYKETTIASISKTPVNGTITIASAGAIIIDTLDVTGKTKGTHYNLTYNIDKSTITIYELTPGALGTSALTITYKTVDPTAVTESDIIGMSDGIGLNTGIFAVKNVYNLTGYIPAYLAAPGFSTSKNVHDVLIENSMKINGHWDARVYSDIPLVDNGTPIMLDTAKTWKDTNGYNNENEKVFFPLIAGTDGKKYHLSVLGAANLHKLLVAQDGIPYKSESNTECEIIKNLYLGEAYLDRVFDDSIVNDKLCQNGITSAAYIGGRWAIFGPHPADYDQANASNVNVFDTCRGMLYYISNDFQDRRALDVDQPMTPNDLKQIVSEEQARIDALIGIGALTYGVVKIDATLDSQSDLISGDFSFTFEVTTTPLAKSLTAHVVWTKQGFVTYFEALQE